MSNLRYFFWILAFGFLFNMQIIDIKLFTLGFFIFLNILCIHSLKIYKTIFQRTIAGCLIILFSILITGEVLYLNGIKSFIFDTVEYNWYFWIQVGYIIIIAPLIGLYYEHKVKY